MEYPTKPEQIKTSKPHSIVSPAEIIANEIKTRGGINGIEAGFFSPPMRQALKDVLGGRPIREYEAAYLARIFDTTSDLWLSLQANYDNCQQPEQLKRQFALPDIDDYPTSILSGDDIRRLCQGDKPMISPFMEKYRRYRISGGLDYHGYCIHLGDQWSVMTAPRIDTANIGASDKHIKLITKDTFTLAPNASVLAVSAERFIMPRNVMALSFGKSTLARIHVVTTITPIEAGWEGYLTIEISNKNKVSEVDLHAGLPITQLVFFWVAEGSGYDGIYQHQQQVPTPALWINK